MPSTSYIITPSLLAKQGTGLCPGEVNSRMATWHSLHTTPADRQYIDRTALFKEGPEICPRVVIKTPPLLAKEGTGEVIPTPQNAPTGEKWESDKNCNKTQQVKSWRYALSSHHMYYRYTPASTRSSLSKFSSFLSGANFLILSHSSLVANCILKMSLVLPSGVSSKVATTRKMGWDWRFQAMSDGSSTMMKVHSFW
jgi:hypothetical protein